MQQPFFAPPSRSSTPEAKEAPRLISIRVMLDRGQQTTAEPYRSRLVTSLKKVAALSMDRALTQLATIEDPIVLWTLQRRPDDLNVPPCLRPDMPEHTEQIRFMGVVADLMWLATRYPDHEPAHAKLRKWWAGPKLYADWHRKALWAFMFVSKRQPSLLAKNLGLSPEQRVQTLTMPTKGQGAARAALRKKSAEMREALRQYAVDHPDPTGRHKPDDIADSRMRLIRHHIHLGHVQLRTAKFYSEVLGIKMSRQNLNKQLDASARARGIEKLIFPSIYGTLCFTK